MQLIDYLRVNPKTLQQTVFKYLRHEEGSHSLRDVGRKALIACTSRTGSSLLQVSLERYGLNAQEYFNPEGPPRRAAESGEAHSLSEYADYLARTAVSNGWFIAKGALNSIFYLYFLNEVPEHTTDWKFIFLRRRNVVRQAISMEIAKVTNQWTANMRAQAPIAAADYSFDAIAKNIESVFQQNDRWERAFGLLNIEPHRVFYEDLCEDLTRETESVAQYLGIDISVFSQAKEYVPWLQPQSTEINLEWERRFRRDLSNQVKVRTLPE
jgi:LPS sulfotransferase NodH